MAQRFEWVLIPSNGTNRKPIPSDESLYTITAQRETSDGVALTMATSDVGGTNWSIHERTGEISKCPGEYPFSNEVCNTTGNFQGLTFLYDGTNRNMVGVRNGKFYKVDADYGVTNIDASSPVTFHTDQPVSMLQYGAYIIVSGVTLTPQKWKHGDANLTALINAGGATGYKFRYIEQFRNRIIGAYSDQTDGQIDIRWTEALPNMSAVSFPAANQLYKPDNDIGITGLKRMGNNACILYGDTSAFSIDYYPDYTPVFGLTEQLTGVGPTYGYSIVDLGDSHIFFDARKGFVQFAGGRQYRVISEPIESILNTIASAYYKLIVGADSGYNNEVCFAVPLNGATSNNALLFYNTTNGQWRIEDRNCDALCFANYYTSFTWTDMVLFNGTTWPTDGRRWSELVSGTGELYYARNNGFVYKRYGSYWENSIPAAGRGDYSSYRIEPILHLHDQTRFKRIQEIHVIGTSTLDFSVNVYWRGGNTEQEIVDSTWELLGTISQDYDSTQVIYTDKTKKYHQFKYGTSLGGQSYKVSRLIVRGHII